MRKKVVIALKMAGVAGQNKLAGIFRYLSERYPDDPSEALKLKRPAAVFAAYDDRVNDLLKTLSLKRVRVPQDIAVLGVDNDTLICENTHPRLSSVMPDFEGEGYLAAETLDSMMHGDGPDSCVLLADIKDVVRRESTCELSSAGLLVQKAVVYIDRHALEGIGVEDVVRHLGCSHRLCGGQAEAIAFFGIIRTCIGATGRFHDLA